METAVANSRQSAGLPSIAFLDIEKSKREEAEYQRKHTAAAMVSPSFQYSCPPPPYSHPSTANAAPAGQQPGLTSPQGSRRTSGDEPQPVSTTRQSLPSIHEALGGSDPGLSYSHSSGSSTSAPSIYQPAAATSTPDPHRRSFPPVPPAPENHHPYSQPPPQSPYMSRPPQAVHAPHTPTTQPDILTRPPIYNSQHPKLPTLQPIRTGNSPVSSLRPTLGYSSAQQPSPAYEAPPPQSAPATAPYSFNSQYPPSYQFGAQQSSNSGPSYPPSATLSAPPRYQPAPHAWRPENDIHGDDRQRVGMPGAPYGESVKRHLDNFDLEASLNEIAECSGKMLEFSREYGARAHPNQRIGVSPQSVPHLQTVDELMQRSRKIQDSLLRIREVVLAQNAAMEEQMKDPARNAPSGYPPDTNGYSDEAKGQGGFAGGDTKKRRGRAAPPGRCHSCNRAETPEWRRGPDGARTLCNACGLHYAKLTRKMGANKAIGSTNLRPKSLGPGSPSN